MKHAFWLLIIAWGCTRINVNKRYAFALESLWHTMLS